MIKITYIEHDGTEHVADVKPGLSVMQGAVGNNIPGIEAECGGGCACATCHIYVDPTWAERTGQRTEMEHSMLECGALVQDNSRLSCQIRVAPELDGLIVRIPPSQR